MFTITHRIQLLPNNKQKTYFCKAIGCSRLAYNWGLDEWKRRYETGERLINGRDIRNSFNAIRKEQFPFTYEVTKYATASAFDDLQVAFNKFFAHQAKFPKKHKKKDGKGSFNIGNDHPETLLTDTNNNLKFLRNVTYNIRGKHQYLNVPNLGRVKMSQRLRFNGKVLGVRISQDGEKFFASFLVKITEKEYLRTHPNVLNEKHGAIGIDLGLKEAMTLSNETVIHNPRILQTHQRKITKFERQLSKRQHAKTKHERLSGFKRSNNYKKLSHRLGKEHRHIANMRRNFTHKLTSILTTTYEAIAIEDLNVRRMCRTKLAKSISDMAFGELRRQIEYKAAMNGVRVEVADRFYPSSKTCSCCGHKRDELTLKERTYVCPHCGAVIDRDLNAARNLLSLITSKVGVDYPELTPADLTALHSRFVLNGIATSKVETGSQHKF